MPYRLASVGHTDTTAVLPSSRLVSGPHVRLGVCRFPKPRACLLTGHGLSLTRFSLNCSGPAHINWGHCGTNVSAAYAYHCSVANLGARDGDEVVMLFHSAGDDVRLTQPQCEKVASARRWPVPCGWRPVDPFLSLFTRLDQRINWMAGGVLTCRYARWRATPSRSAL